MDFSSQLANLQRTANAAASSRDQGGGGGPERRRNQLSPDRRRHAPYDHRQRRRHGRGRGPGPRDYRESNLKHAIASLPRYRPRSSARDKNEVPHLALLFITIDDLPYEEIWKEWCSHQEEAGMHISVLCHAKHPDKVKSDWLRQRLLVCPPVVGRGHGYEPPTYHTRSPEWGSIEITRAMLDLLYEGLQIGYSKESDPRFSTDRYAVGFDKATPVDKFVFCSETCLPVTTLKEAKTLLFGGTDVQGDDKKVDSKPESKQDGKKKPEDEADSKDESSKTVGEAESKEDGVVIPENVVNRGRVFSKWDQSWIHARNAPNNGYSRQLQFDKVDRAIPGPNIWKADQWIVLSRPHAAAVMDIDRNLPRDAPLWRCFLQCKASDEMYFPTALLGLLSVKDDVENRRVTFADWSESAKNPASYTKGVQDLKTVACLARGEGCLFARKFSPFEISQVGSVREDAVSATGMITVEDWKSVIKELPSES